MDVIHALVVARQESVHVVIVEDREWLIGWIKLADPILQDCALTGKLGCMRQRCLVILEGYGVPEHVSMDHLPAFASWKAIGVKLLDIRELCDSPAVRELLEIYAVVCAHDEDSLPELAQKSKGVLLSFAIRE